MVNTGLGDKIPFTFGTAEFEKKEPLLHELASTNGKKKKKVPRTNGSCLKLVLELLIPALVTCPDALDWTDAEWFENVTEAMTGAAKVKWQSLLSKEYAVEKNNRVQSNFEHALKEFVTKLSGTPYPGDSTLCWLKNGNATIGSNDPSETPPT